MMIEDRFFEQQWVQELSNEDFRMLLYLFAFASKCGIVELNMRMLNFASNTGHNYTKEEILDRFSNVLCLVPGRTDTAIFPDYIATNWAKGKPVDVDRAPLFRGVVNELSSFGLTIEKLNLIAKKKIILKGVCDGQVNTDTSGGMVLHERRIKVNTDEKFETFWAAYPKECPRKTDKKKCREKFDRYLQKAGDAETLFSEIMNGLAEWKQSSLWRDNGGQYIMAPIRWLNNENWKESPKKGVVSNGSNRATANNNVAGNFAGVF